MSTRSGRRIHASPEQAVAQTLLKTEMKTRSRKTKETLKTDYVVPKKKHYVLRQTSDDDPCDGTTNDVEISRTRKSRRTLLKKNSDMESFQIEKDSHKTTKTNRRKKKEKDELTVLQKSNKSKVKKCTPNTSIENINGKNITYSERVIKKKTSSGSVVVEDLTECLGSESITNNTSNDSFHSAAGSLDNCGFDSVSGCTKLSLRSDVNGIESIEKLKSNDSQKNKKKVGRKKCKNLVKNDSVNHDNVFSYDNENHKKTVINMSVDDLSGTNSNYVTKDQKNLYDIEKEPRSPIKLDLQASHIENQTFVNDSNSNCISYMDTSSKQNNLMNDKKKNKKDNKTYEKKQTPIALISNRDDSDSKLISTTKNFESNSTMTMTENSVVTTGLDSKHCEANIVNGKGSVIVQRESDLNATFDKENSDTKDFNEGNVTGILNSTFDIIDNPSVSTTMFNDEPSKTHDNKMNVSCYKDLTVRQSQNKIKKVKESDYGTENSEGTHNMVVDLDTTYEKENPSVKNSIISPDSSNITKDNSLSRISITSDDSKVDNINTTPVLIESSLEESQNNFSLKTTEETNSTEEGSKVIETPLMQREGTFTKQIDDQVITPNNGRTSSGCTPFPSSKHSSSKKVLLNVTHSLEKSRRSSISEHPRNTRVMFCSPINTPMTTVPKKGKLIKSSLKGSNKSFVFSESAPQLVSSARKRSYTQSDIEEIEIKRKRLISEQKASSDRLSRSRSSSASGAITPLKITPATTKPESRVTRKKLPNFAALHQKQFDKMESLDECQERKAKRAKQMLAIIPNCSSKDKDDKADTLKMKTQKKKELTLESINPSYTRFGFRVKTDANPFLNKKDNFDNSLSVTQSDTLNGTGIFTNTNRNNMPSVSKTAVKSKENIPTVLKRQATLPSLTGTTARKDLAKQTIMREKSFSEKSIMNRKENRTIIKGVRTNRRFELQMQMRNLS